MIGIDTAPPQNFLKKEDSCILYLLLAIWTGPMIKRKVLKEERYQKADVSQKPQPSSTPSCRKSARVTQSQNVPVSCFSQPIGQWPAQAA